jgi:predicted phosphodiesterase
MRTLFTILVSCWCLGFGYAAENPLFSFGAIADCQYCDADSKKRRYRLSPEKLKKCVDHLNTMDLSFVVHLGDFIDRDWKSFDVVVPIYKQLKAPHYHVLGNHDFDVADDKKLLVPERLGLKSRYYSFERGNWRFIAVDGNDVSLYAYPKGSKLDMASKAIYDAMAKKPPRYNGAVGKMQLAWLQEQFDAARKAKQRVILFCHFPVFPKNGHNLWNDNEITRLLAANKDIIAWINGHNHAGNYGRKGGIHYLTLKGMVDTEETSYAVVDVYENKLEIRGFGRETSRSLNFSAAEQ